MTKIPTSHNLITLSRTIKAIALDAGFGALGITDVDLGEHTQHYEKWIAAGHHADMSYMTKHGSKRWRPAELVPQTCRVISVRMDYLPPNPDMAKELSDRKRAYVSIYARGRDYHKLIRKKLARLAQEIQGLVGEFGYRVFVDSAPVLERALAEKSGLGWIGKNSCVISRQSGSWFFLGEIFTDLPLPVDAPHDNEHCGRCTQCIDLCPTQAIVAPYTVDSRRCISYLTIENKGDIPEQFRSAMGNRIFGCDDCQLVCPWNKFAQTTPIVDFWPRQHLDGSDLTTLFDWSKEAFVNNTQGSPIKRTGYEGWLRNLAVALGNAPTSPSVIKTLKKRRENATPMVKRHIEWALMKHAENQSL